MAEKKACSEAKRKGTAGLTARYNLDLHFAADSTPDYSDIFSLDAQEKQKLKGVGCSVVRNIYSSQQAGEWFKNLKDYVAANRHWPVETPFILNLYYSPTQVAARSRPHQQKLSEELNALWHDDTGTGSPEPLSYADGIRIRPLGVPFYGLGPHIDAGSLSRWADTTYQLAYEAVFSGNPELLGNYDLTHRKSANQAYFPGSAHSRVLRCFQGWTTLTSTGPRQGSLMLYPNVKWIIAYVVLRPFFKQPEAEDDTMDATKWEFDPSEPWFQGSFRADSQLLSPSSHPHLRLKDCLVSIPRMNAGDTIRWHSDMCHAVEVEHSGGHDASVAYIAATPRTEENKSYIKGQLEDFLNGLPPEDFRKGPRERDFSLFTGEGSIAGEAGRRAMGFDLIA
ncbi:Fc.00g074300.m01.CDS01 [Cosmosporella sp. VM-42]